MAIVYPSLDKATVRFFIFKYKDQKPQSCNTYRLVGQQNKNREMNIFFSYFKNNKR